jgi:hypothetical protein
MLLKTRAGLEITREESDAARIGHAPASNSVGSGGRGFRQRDTAALTVEAESELAQVEQNTRNEVWEGAVALGAAELGRLAAADWSGKGGK